MKRKHVESREAKDEEANRFKDDLSSVQQSTNLTSHGQKENSVNDQKDSVKERAEEGENRRKLKWRLINQFNLVTWFQ